MQDEKTAYSTQKLTAKNDYPNWWNPATSKHKKNVRFTPISGSPQMFIHFDRERSYLHEFSLSGKKTITMTTMMEQ